MLNIEHLDNKKVWGGGGELRVKAKKKKFEEENVSDPWFHQADITTEYSAVFLPTLLLDNWDHIINSVYPVF